MLGIFDSGIGGLTVLKEIRDKFSDFDILYLADHENVPYGDRSHDQIFELVQNSVEWMFDQGCTFIILACNSASAQALRKIQQTKLKDFQGKNVLGVIRPTVEFLQKRDFEKAAIFATQATCNSQTYQKELQKQYPEASLKCHAFPAWVPLIESGEVDEKRLNEVKEEVEEVYQKMPDIEVVVLACTHYPILFDTVRSGLPESVELISQGEIIVDSLADYLDSHPEYQISKNGKTQYFTTGDPKLATKTAQNFLDKSIKFSGVRL